jgi:hypothetical protein
MSFIAVKAAVMPVSHYLQRNTNQDRLTSGLRLRKVIKRGFSIESALKRSAKGPSARRKNREDSLICLHSQRRLTRGALYAACPTDTTHDFAVGSQIDPS